MSRADTYAELEQLLAQYFWPDWTEHYADEFYRLQAQRVSEGRCTFCGKDLSEQAGVYFNKYLPSQEPTCSEQCAHWTLMLYCMLEGK